MFFKSKDLRSISSALKNNYKRAKPFPYLIIDDFLPKKEAITIARDFPGPNDINWVISGSGANSDSFEVGSKRECSDEEQFPKSIRSLLLQFNSNTFLTFIKDLTNLSHIIVDPSYKGCGLHSTGNNGRLMIHADGNRYPVNRLFYQSINMIYYVTEKWDKNWGGNLELWDRDCKNKIKEIEPKFNRLLLFNTGRYSYHGYPSPINCPNDIRRNSIAVYYYVPSRNFGEDHEGFVGSVLWKRTNKRDSLFNKEFLKNKLFEITAELIPPLVVRIYVRLKLGIKKFLNKKDL